MPTLALLVGCSQSARRCPVIGLGETHAEVSLTRRGDRIEGFSYSMSRPVGESAHECQRSASRRPSASSNGAFEPAPSTWSEAGGVTRVSAPDGSGRSDVEATLTPRPNGVRMAFMQPDYCGTFLLPEAVEVEWTEQGCTARAVNWDQPGTVVVDAGAFNMQVRRRLVGDEQAAAR